MAISDIKISLKIEEGKHYRMSLPNGVRDKKVHVDYILDNPTDPDPNSKLVIYRYWLRSKGRWHHDVREYWILDLYNKHK